MNRSITYQAGLYEVGAHAGKIVVTRQPGRHVRYSVGALTKEDQPPRVRTWANSTGQGIAVELTVGEEGVGPAVDHWATAEAAIRDRFPGVEIVYRD